MFSLEKNFVREQNKLISHLIEELLDKTVAFRTKEKRIQEKEDSFFVLEENLGEIARILEEHFLESRGREILLQICKERKDLKKDIQEWESKLKEKSQNSTQNTKKTKPTRGHEKDTIPQKNSKEGSKEDSKTQNKVIEDFGSILLVED